MTRADEYAKLAEQFEKAEESLTKTDTDKPIVISALRDLMADAGRLVVADTTEGCVPAPVSKPSWLQFRLGKPADDLFTSVKSRVVIYDIPAPGSTFEEVVSSVAAAHESFEHFKPDTPPLRMLDSSDAEDEQVASAADGTSVFWDRHVFIEAAMSWVPDLSEKDRPRFDLLDLVLTMADGRTMVLVTDLDRDESSRPELFAKLARQSAIACRTLSELTKNRPVKSLFRPSEIEVVVVNLERAQVGYPDGNERVLRPDRDLPSGSWKLLAEAALNEGRLSPPDHRAEFESWRREQKAKGTDQTALATEMAGKRKAYKTRRDTWMRAKRRLNEQLRALLDVSDNPFELDEGVVISRFKTLVAKNH